MATSYELMNNPRNIDEAQNSSDWIQWEQAMKEELKSLEGHQTWNLVALPPGKKAISRKWVFKKKLGPDGSISRYKASWVVRGYEQQYGLDYDQTFAAVVKPASYRTLFAMAAMYDWVIEQLDVKTAFFYGKIDTKVYVEQPHGFRNSDKVCHLNPSLYGLKQSPRLWYLTISAYLCKNGFSVSNADPSILINVTGIILLLYVDDVLLISPRMDDINDAKALLCNAFETSDMQPCSFYLDMQLHRDHSVLTETRPQLLCERNSGMFM
jgi:hypothetical protein